MTLVERLRDTANLMLDDAGMTLVAEAADEIERLEKAPETAREDAIEEAAKVALSYDGGGRKHNDVGWALSDVAAAIRALSQKKEG